MSRNTIGLACRPSRRQESSSITSSSVPMPPGRMAKASAASNIIILRSCIELHDHRLDRRQRPLVRGEEMRDDAQHAAAGGVGGAGAGAHQADAAAAVDQPQALAGQGGARARRRRRGTRGRRRWTRRSRRRPNPAAWNCSAFAGCSRKKSAPWRAATCDDLRVQDSPTGSRVRVASRQDDRSAPASPWPADLRLQPAAAGRTAAGAADERPRLEPSAQTTGPRLSCSAARTAADGRAAAARLGRAPARRCGWPAPAAPAAVRHRRRAAASGA